MTDANIVSTEASKVPIYMWYDSGTIYWWSVDTTPLLNDQSNSMFRTMSNLTDISGLESFDASGATNLNAAFSYLSTITNLTPLANWDISNVTTLNGIFQWDLALADLTPLSNWNVSNVTSMLQAFNNNTSLTTLHGLESWDTSKVTSMGKMFMIGTTQYQNGYRSALSDASALINWNTSNVQDMQYMFQYTNLTTLHGLENWNTSNVNNMIGMFLGNLFLNDASAINDWDIAKVTNFNEMFWHAPSHPTFSKRAGTWKSDGTFTPSS